MIYSNLYPGHPRFDAETQRAALTFEGAVRWWHDVWEWSAEHFAAGRELTYHDAPEGRAMQAEADLWCERCRQELATLEANDPQGFARVKAAMLDEASASDDLFMSSYGFWISKAAA